jgi:hypothetical protein
MTNCTSADVPHPVLHERDATSSRLEAALRKDIVCSTAEAAAVAHFPVSAHARFGLSEVCDHLNHGPVRRCEPR